MVERPASASVLSSLQELTEIAFRSQLIVLRKVPVSCTEPVLHQWLLLSNSLLGELKNIGRLSSEQHWAHSSPSAHSLKSSAGPFKVIGSFSCVQHWALLNPLAMPLVNNTGPIVNHPHVLF
jgi:hypothetical protein